MKTATLANFIFILTPALVNGTRALPGFMLNGTANQLLGPGFPGMIGTLGYLAPASLLLFHHRAFAVGEEASSQMVQAKDSTLIYLSQNLR